MRKILLLRHHLVKNRGFALVVTLSLMILLTIIAVGLLSLSSIALRSTSSSSAMSMARQNARMAMMLAIGELQKHAGQDQRVTATADMAGDASGLRASAGAAPKNNTTVNGVAKGLSSVQAGTRYWTGIFANKNTPVSIFTKTPDPAIVHWLVSGCTTNYPSSGPNIQPSDSAYAVSSNGNVSDPTKAVVLAGANTVGSGASDNFVVAPVVTVRDSKTSKPSGRYGFWVGDEGVKARINMRKTLDGSNSYAALTAQRRGWETISGFESYPIPSSGIQTSLPKVTSLAQAELLIPAAGGGNPSPLQNVFHSATADSRAVLTDTLNGGTRIDLTALLASGLPSGSAVAEIPNYPTKGGNIIPKKSKDGTNIAPNMKAPLWDAVKDAYDRYGLLTGGSLIVKPASSDFIPAVAPIITDFRILMGVNNRIRGNTKGNGTTIPDIVSINLNACGKIALAIANPYSTPLKWNNDLEFEIKSQTPPPNNKPSRIWNLGDKTAFLPQTPSNPAVFNNAIFRIKPSILAPGEARAYTMTGQALRTAASATSRLVVDLGEFTTSNPANFKNCIGLENDTVTQVASFLAPPPNNIPITTPGMDVRESWQTTLAKLEMRLAGSSGILRQIERFELDNGYFSKNIRKFDYAQANKADGPIPLIVYNFQITQPGIDYKKLGLIPGSYEMGQRGTTQRTFTDFNLQATRIRKPIASYNPPPYFMQISDSLGSAAFDPGLTGSAFVQNLVVSPLRWGHSNLGGSQKTVLFSAPSQFSSLAELQHADLTGDDTMASIGHQPGNAAGNSYATPFVKRSMVIQNRTDYELIGVTNQSGTNNTPTNYYDLSYLLNASLWDSYFFSTIPRSGVSVPENPSLIRFSDADASGLKDPVEAAPLLMVDGAFNVNSTDKNAWKAFLASAKHFKHSADTTSSADAAFPRSLEQISPSATQPTGKEADSFSGYRRLTDAQIDALAEEIVKQVRLRGPFVSVSHFVNRALASLTSQPALTRSGALQSAIDESGANINFAGTKNAFLSIKLPDDAVTLREIGGAPRADMEGSDQDGRPASVDSSNPDWAIYSTDNNYGAVASIIADREMLLDSTHKREQGYRSTGIPGWLTQADVLQVIGPSLTARSDTFRIRGYGEALDGSGKTIAKAYCEAIVQRVPNYVDSADRTSARGTNLSSINKIHGRKFEFVSFRWLSPQEI